MPEAQKRVARLRQLAEEFRRIADEYADLDGALAGRLIEIVTELEQEAAELERDVPSES